ncbi:CHAT domain-containing protein [Aspergillus tetrazonus]
MDEVRQGFSTERAALDAMPESHIDWPRFFEALGNELERSEWADYLNEHGLKLYDQYLENDILSELEEGVTFIRGAIHLTPEDDPDHPKYLNNLGNLLGDRYIRTGSVADLEEAVDVGQKAINAIPKDHPNRPRYLNNLGNQLNDRYLITGVLADLDEAIQVGWEAIRLTPEDHPHRPALFNNLGNRLGDKYLRTNTLDDLNEAIHVKQEALKVTPEGHPDRAGRLNNLAIELSARYLRTFDAADIENAIEAGREAVKITRAGHADLPMYLHSLGNSLDYSGSNLEEAVRVGREAVKVTPEDHPDRPMALNSLGKRLGERHSMTGGLADLEEAITCHQSALCQLNASTIHRIVAGRAVIRLCAIRKEWQRALTAVEIAIDLVPKLTLRSLEISDKQHMLGQVVGFASDAAAVALNVEKGPAVALGYLEQGRALLATSLEEMRTDILDLQEQYPLLAEKFVSLRDRLELPIDNNNFPAEEDIQSFYQAHANARHKAASDLDKLIDEIRTEPGFNDFLLPPNIVEMQAAAKRGPIILINTSDYRCDAIIVEEHQIRSLNLPSLNNHGIKKRAEKGDLASPNTLEWLWDAIASPVLQTLGFSQCPLADSWPHIWWIPTGLLTKFALHAAGRYTNGPSESVLDSVMSSYSSSVKAIIHGRRHPSVRPTSAQALLVAMDYIPGSPPLPFATEEVVMLHNLCKSMGLTPTEPGRRKADVEAHLPQCKIFHFAGHGYTDNSDPSKSYLLLEDAHPLSVANLLQINIREHLPFLAYLSACGTGQIRDERFLDESIHLISGFQLAGFRHVIGTLWEVNDEICVEIARNTYEGIRDGDMTDDSVCRGLHKAIRGLRDRWLNKPSKVSRGRSTIMKADVSSTADVKSVTNAVESGNRLQRDVVPYDNDGEDDRGFGEALWVPYVHFGV